MTEGRGPIHAQKSEAYSVDLMVGAVRRVEELSGRGVPVSQAAKKVGISEEDFYWWHSLYEWFSEKVAALTQALEQENAQLKRIVAEQALEITMLKNMQAG
jgi:hypothetical protein